MATTKQATPEQERAFNLIEQLYPMAAVMREHLDQHWVEVHNELACNISTQVKQTIGQLRAQNPEDTTFAMADVEHYIKQTAQMCVDETEFWLPSVAEDDCLTQRYYDEINS